MFLVEFLYPSRFEGFFQYKLSKDLVLYHLHKKNAETVVWYLLCLLYWLLGFTLDQLERCAYTLMGCGEILTPQDSMHNLVCLQCPGILFLLSTFYKTHLKQMGNWCDVTFLQTIGICPPFFNCNLTS